MIRVGFLAAGFVIAVAARPALSADDQALLDRVLLSRVRPMAVSTALVEKGTARARLVTPMTGEWLDAPLKLDLAKLGGSVQPRPFTPATALKNAKPLSLSWRFDDFPRTPLPLHVVGVGADPEPRKSYRPVERLIQGQYSSSTGSCLFPKGETVTIDLELQEASTVSEVRIRAWEMSDNWQTSSRTLHVSNDGQTWTPVPGTFEIVGTERWGGNVNTIYGQPVDREVRFVRVTAEPASETGSVYLAEIEVLGTDAGEPPSLTALAGIDLDGDGSKETVVGTGGGQVVALDATGRRRWQADVGAQITALAGNEPSGVGPQSVVYGASRDLLGLIGPNGEKVKEIHIPQYRGIPSEPRNITVADLDGDGVASIVVGVRSWQYLAYSPELELQWNNVIYAHSATVAEVADLDGDGTMETVAGNAYFRLNIISSDGKRRVTAGRFGPEQTAVTSADLDGDGRREVVIGTDGGDVLAFGLEGNKLWERNVGDRVTSLAPVTLDGKTAVIAASESSYLWAFDADGKPLWRTTLGEPVRRLIPSGETLVCAASGAGVVVLSRSGAVLSVAATPTPVMDIAVLGDQCVAQLADGSVCGVSLGDR